MILKSLFFFGTKHGVAISGEEATWEENRGGGGGGGSHCPYNTLKRQYFLPLVDEQLLIFWRGNLVRIMFLVVGKKGKTKGGIHVRVAILFINIYYLKIF